VSDVLIQKDIREARADAAKLGMPPRESWLMECVQEDHSNPLPCTDADKKAWPNGQAPAVVTPTVEEKPTTPAAGADAGETGESDEDLEALIMGKKKPEGADAGVAPGTPSTPTTEPTDEELERMIMGGGAKDGG
jgi:C4-dicarboxylate transporter DctM subunit